MLCPETWNFQPPPHHIFVDVVDFKKSNMLAVVKNHYFNHSISMVLPDTVTVPQSLHDCLSEDTDYYRINNLCVSDLLNIEFIEAFVKKGEINILTIENKIDLQNSICVTPTGQLVLFLLADDYQALGLEGKRSVFSHKLHTRYIVGIDLTNETFVPGKNNYERVRIALQKRLTQKFDVIVSWDPPDINKCPSSIAAWFHARNYNVCLCRQKFSRRAYYSLAIPTYEDECNDKNKTDADFFEWLGVFSINGDLSISKEDDYANTYRCPSPSVQVGQVQYLQWTGFFTRRKIQQAYDALKKYVLSRNALPWVSLDIQGFADSPISFNLREHMFFTDGDNSYTIVFRPKGDAVVRRSLSSNNNKVKNN
ncbi:ribonuclease P protein subunit p40 [Solenopsis invicta]|uniref:ribonuclease P protein subunit p40 n=1 Tax=Solenopsis invicta TaxID=13686 RepID=UPI000E33E92D|nr:ribonuclease P protein subunit p40 [Solenopsis invicta]XP_025993577.1 ribonuclease P protein subunit p40 [Solenopsis invicta]